MSRLLLVGHAATARTREAVFGDTAELERPVQRMSGRVDSWVAAPEPACEATATGLRGGPVTGLVELAGCDFGRWAGRALVDVAAIDPVGLDRWLRDPDARPHDGETLGELVVRIGAAVDGHGWPVGGSVAVVTPMVARAAAVAALRAPASVIFRLDVGPLGAVGLSGSAGAWRLQELRRSVSSSG